MEKQAQFDQLTQILAIVQQMQSELLTHQQRSDPLEPKWERQQCETEPSPYDSALEAVRKNAEIAAKHAIEDSLWNGRMQVKTCDSPLDTLLVPEMSDDNKKAYVDSQVAEAERRFVNALVKLAE